IGELPGIVEPLPTYSRYKRVHNRRNTTAVCTRSAAAGTRLILRAINRHWPTRAPGNDVSGVAVARSVLRFLVVDVLPVSRGTQSIDPRAVVTRAIGHASGKGIRDLILQTMSHLLLHHGLQ